MGNHHNHRNRGVLLAVLALLVLSSCHLYQRQALRPYGQTDEPPAIKPETKVADDNNREPEPESRRQPRFARRVSALLLKSSLQLAPEDVLEIRVKDQPELSETVKVDPWGFIKVPYIRGLQVNGLTEDKVEELLTQKYAEFFRQPPEIEVSVLEYNSQVIYVLGAVTTPGKYPLIKGRPMTLRDAITAAGLPTQRAALWRVWVIRQSEAGPVYTHVNFRKVLYRGELKDNLELQPGDVVYLPMGVLDTIVVWIGRIVGPIVGLGRSSVTTVVQ